MYSYDTAPAETLPEAVNRAQTVVLGQVTRVEHAASQGFTQTLVTVRIDETWRGAPVREAVFWLAGGPSLVGDREVLGHEPVAPPLFKDDSVALLLNPAGSDRWSVVPWDGVYFVSGDRIAPGLPETPVGRAVAGQPLADFAAAVKAVP